MEAVSSICPAIQRAFEILGKKWVSLILHTLLDGQLFYRDLQRAVPRLSDRVLSQRMKELETEGLVERIVSVGSPIRVSYRLTPRGAALRPVLEGIAIWANEFQSDNKATE
jgi:DNA-binding HxlR family transcriptional regulator